MRPDLHRSWRDVRFAAGLAATALVASAVTLLAWAVIPALLPGWSVSVVESGSMAPRIREGDVVAARAGAPAGVEPGDVVLFDDGSGLTLHRIVGLEGDGYVTKGDANASADSATVTPAMVRGIGTILVPWVGWPHRWAVLGHWGLMSFLAAAMAAALHASRWATDPETDPWPDTGGGPPTPVEVTAPVMAPGLLPAAIRHEVLLAHRRRR